MPTFDPRNHELIEILNKKITGNYDSVASSEINELNICRHEPEEFPGLVCTKSSHTWYFISPVEKLKGRCRRTKRKAPKTGHWKISGKNCYVKEKDGSRRIIGFKKFLVFKENKKHSSSSSSSSWKIHEYHSNIQHPNKDAFVLCKLMKETRTPTPREPIANDSPLVTRPILTPDHIRHFQMQNDIVVEPNDQSFFDGANDDISRIRNNMIDGDVFSSNSIEDIYDHFYEF